MTTTLKTPTVRLSFPFLDRKNNNDKYSAAFVFDPKTLNPKGKELLAAMTKAAKDALREKFGDKAFNPDGTPKQGYKMPYRDGSERYGEGMMYFNCTTQRRIGLGIAVRDGNRVVIQDTDDAEKFYPGCYVQAQLSVYAYNKDGNKGVSFGVQHVVFLKDGERFDGGASSASEAFEASEIDPSEVDFEDASNDEASGAGDVSLLV